MHPHKLTAQVFLFLIVVFSSVQNSLPKGATSSRPAVVVDERLAALRHTPQLNGPLVRRLSRGRRMTIRGSKTTPDGVVFLRVNVTSRTRGWIQREAVVSPGQAGDDRRLFDLIKASYGFDQIVRARIFLDNFPRSPLRPKVLLLLGNTAESQASELSRDAAKRLNLVTPNTPSSTSTTPASTPNTPSSTSTTPASTPNTPSFTYFLNYSGLDRYNRQRVYFIFNRTTKHFHYDGASWRELIRHYPNSPEAPEARKRLAELEKSPHVHPRP